MTDYLGTRAVPREDLGEALLEYDGNARDFIGTQILPEFKVAEQAAKFSKHTRQSILQNPETARAARGNYNRILTALKDDSYACENHGLEGLIDDSERLLYQSDFDAEMETTMVVERAVLLGLEMRIKDLVFDTNTWTGSDLFTDNSGSPWSTAATNVIAQVQAGKEKVRRNGGGKADSLIVGEESLQNLLKNEALIARFPGIEVLTEEILRRNIAAIFGLKKLIVGAEVYDSSPLNQSESHSATVTDVWPKTYAMIARTADNGAPLKTPCLGRTFIWEAYAAALWKVETYREEQAESDVVRVKNFVDEKIFDPAFGHLLQIETA